MSNPISRDLHSHFRCFLSYSRKDASRIVGYSREILRAVIGDRVFLDLYGIEPGEDWQAKIEESIRQCSIFFLFWSKHAATSPFVARERLLATVLEKKIVPILLDETPLPPGVDRPHFVDGRVFGLTTESTNRTEPSASIVPRSGAIGLKWSAPPGSQLERSDISQDVSAPTREAADAPMQADRKLPWFLALITTSIAAFFGGTMMSRAQPQVSVPISSLYQTSQQQEEIAKLRQLILQHLGESPQD